jgi:RimJ/RimL family protein N-acetyltransferase
MNIEPIVLDGQVVRLVPMTRDHIPDLCAIGLDPELWTWVPNRMEGPEDMATYVTQALADQARGVALPFVTTERATGRVIGSTRFGSIERAHRRLEIGWTWIARDFQRSAVNTEAKYLMLSHAFDHLGANRVELKTDVLNARSRAAILRLGAAQEGIFRKHLVCDSGRIRDSVYFSIIDEEWPAVKAGLLAKLARSDRA